MNNDISRITFSDDVMALAGTITLADLLESPMAMADTVSMIANITRHGGDYNHLKQDADYDLELLLFRISQSIDGQTRSLLFSHLRNRRNSK